MTASLTTAGNNISRAKSWSLVLLACVICNFSIASTAQAETVRDEFDAISYSGNNGTANWTGNWIEDGEADGPSAGFLQVTSDAACTAGNCMRVGFPVPDNGENDNTWLYREANLSGATLATFTYDFATSQNDRGWVHVEVSGNGGSGWTTLASYDLNAGAASGSESFDITAFIASDTQVRFRGTNRNDTPGLDQFRGFLHFDDIEISYVLPPDIVKRSYETDGTVIPSGSVIPDYLEFKYLLYINNTGVAISDVSVRDVLDAAFQYQTGTIQIDNSVAECALTTCTPAEELAIFTSVDGAAVLTDAVDGDAASFAGSTLDAGNQYVGNPQLNISADTVWAILFSVKMP